MKKDQQLLKVAFVIFGVVALLYGILFLLVPQSLVSISGSEPVPSGWLRWPGGILVALGIGAFLALKNLSGQETFAITISLVTLLSGLALLFSLIFERVTTVWFTITPVIINLAVSVLFWICLKKPSENKEEKK